MKKCSLWFALFVLILLVFAVYGFSSLQKNEPIISETVEKSEPVVSPIQSYDSKKSPLESENQMPKVSSEKDSSDRLYLDLTAGELGLNETTVVHWNLANVAQSAGLVLNLQRDVPESERFDYVGATGPLTLKPIPINSTIGKINWKAGQVGCAPTDFPTWCDIQPGDYYLEGTVYDQSNFSILERVMPLSPEPKELRKIRSSGFTLTGKPNFLVLSNNLQSAVHNLVVETFKVDQGGGIFNMGSFVTPAPDLEVISENKICREFSLQPPFSGLIEACADPLKRARAELEVLQNLTLLPEVVDYLVAKNRAQTAAENPYLSRVAFKNQPTPQEAGYVGNDMVNFYEWSNQNPEATTYLSSTVRDWHAQPDAWLFVYEVEKAGGSETGADRFSDTVLIKVPHNDEAACIVETVPKRSFDTDYKSRFVVCP